MAVVADEKDIFNLLFIGVRAFATAISNPVEYSAQNLFK